MPNTPEETKLIDERRARALQLSVRGRKPHQVWEQINKEAAERGWKLYKDADHCQQDISRALKIARDKRLAMADEYFENELERLAEMDNVYWQVLERKHYLVNQGRVVYLGYDPERKGKGWNAPEELAAELRAQAEPLEDDAHVLECLDGLRKNMERRSKFLGFDAAIKKQVEVSTGTSSNDAINAVAMAIIAGAGQAAGVTPPPLGAGTPDVPDTRTAGELSRRADGEDAGA
jgi:hypothetical protein